jgi:hypothetical protein
VSWHPWLSGGRLPHICYPQQRDQNLRRQGLIKPRPFCFGKGSDHRTRHQIHGLKYSLALPSPTLFAELLCTTTTTVVGSSLLCFPKKHAVVASKHNYSPTSCIFYGISRILLPLFTKHERWRQSNDSLFGTEKKTMSWQDSFTFNPFLQSVKDVVTGSPSNRCNQCLT